jgi:hypothetical protein
MSLKIKAEHPGRSCKLALAPRPMTRWLAAFAVLLAAGGGAPCLARDGQAAAAAQLDPERLALANEVIDLSYPPAGRRAMLMGAVDTMTDQARAAVAEATGAETDAGLERILERYLARVRVQTERVIAEHSAPLFAAYARAYARQFTRDELVQIRAFVSTPTGRKYVQQTISMLSDPDVARANTAYMTSAFSALQSMQAELNRELQAYMRGRRGRPAANPTS